MTVVLSLSLLLAACRPAAEPARILELDDQPAALPPAGAMIFVTPTPAPTLVPTLAIILPTATLPPPTATPAPTLTPDTAQQQAACQQALEALYFSAGDVCLGKPNGYFCNGGLPPRTDPAGPLSSALALPGSLVAAQEVQAVQTAPLLQDNAGGLMWLRLAEFVQLDALLVGSVELRDVTPANMGFSAWQSFTVVTDPRPQECAAAPRSTFILQSFYGQSTRVVINGVSVDLNGTLAVQTDSAETLFSVLEGEAGLTILGQSRRVVAGQLLRVPYAPGSYALPAQAPLQPEALVRALIEHLPITLLDRPVLLPQPGYIITEANVNMRARPDANSLLLYAVPAGETLSLLGQNMARDWLHVRLGNGDTGWMRADLVGGQPGDITALYDATPVPPQRPGDLGTDASVIAPQGGNLRRAPDVGFPVIATIPEGTAVKLLERSPYSPWVKVDVNGTIGWMALITLETRAAISFLPVDYAVPLPPRPTATPVFRFGGGHAYPDPNSGQ
ncbi:MAG: SH3 domain-containing protein [Anaerolineae bacterium]|nr:SH3 domain-containing protein [Anaerolineae bacterium]